MLLRNMTEKQWKSKILDYVISYYNSDPFRRQLRTFSSTVKNRRVPSRHLITTKHTFKDGTVMHTAFYKYYYMKGAHKAADISCAHYFEILVPKTGKVGYLMPQFDQEIPMCIAGFTFFTYHCICRIRERAGKDFFSVVAVDSSSRLFFQRTDNGSLEGILGDNKYHVFGYEGDNGFTYVTTFVTNSMLYENQEQVSAELKEMYKEYMEKYYAA